MYITYYTKCKPTNPGRWCCHNGGWTTSASLLQITFEHWLTHVASRLYQINTLGISLTSVAVLGHRLLKVNVRLFALLNNLGILKYEYYLKTEKKVCIILF